MSRAGSSLLIKHFLITELLILLIKQDALKRKGPSAANFGQIISNCLTRVKFCILQSFSKHKLFEIRLAASFDLLQPVSFATLKFKAAQVSAGVNVMERRQNCQSCLAILLTLRQSGIVWN